MKNMAFASMLGSVSLVVAIFTTGCEVNVNEQASSDTTPATQSTTTTTTTPTSTPTTTPPATTPPATNPTTTNAPPVNSVDELDISSAKLFGEHSDIRPQEAAITRDLYSANKQGETVKLSFETLGWSTRELSGKTIDASVHIFWVEGTQVVGGMFDWHGQGQTTKTLGNIYHNYLGGKPAAGTTIYFCLVSLDEKQRTNVVKSDTPW